ncbi:MAG: alpha-amylase family glycosyl hydrolase [Bacteroidota bacterium]
MNLRKTTFLLLIWGLFSQMGMGQILEIDPIFATLDDSITIVYNASEGNGALEGLSPVYAHMGLITTNSTSATDWKYVQGQWGTADPKVLMTDLGNNRHQIKISGRDFYGIPQNETALQLSFVFRTADGTTVGRDTDGSDIYYDLYQGSGQAILILSPNEGQLVDQGNSVTLSAAVAQTADLTLTVNGTQVATTNGKSISTSYTATQGGRNVVVLTANDGNSIESDSTFFLVPAPNVVQDPPAGTEPGINYINDSTVILALYAPEIDLVYAIGDFNDWIPTASNQMKESTDGLTYWTEITGLTAGKEYVYQYLVNGTLTIADPFADKILDENNDQFIGNATYPDLIPFPSDKASGRASVLQTAQTPYPWSDSSYVRPPSEELVIYELLVRDFVEARNYQTVIDSLDYIAGLGVNAIELMPIMEFEGNSSWGYNPSFFFAVDKYYGTKNDLKAFIDSCHNRGIAVILDMVLNHAFGQNEYVRMYPSANNPFFNQEAKHPFNVGTDFNHESVHTRFFSKEVLAYWIEEFHFDGYRMDLSKGFTQVFNTDVGAWSNYDASRIAILKDYNNHLKSVDPTAYFMLEHFAQNQEERELAAEGMLIWGNHNFNYTEATMGYHDNGKSNFAGISYKDRGFTTPELIGYMESHDEERLMYKNLEFGNIAGDYSAKNIFTALERNEMAGAFFFTIPGPKLMWMFGEVGYELPIDFNGRTGEKPIRWEYFAPSSYHRRHLYQVWSSLIKLRNAHDVFHTNDFVIDAGNAVKRIKLNGSDMDVFVIGNFDVVSQNVASGFQSTGTWYDYYTGDSLDVASTQMMMNLEAGEWHLFTTVKLSSSGVTVSNESEIKMEENSILVYPNPAINQLNIDFDRTLLRNVSVDVLNLQGQILFHQENLTAGTSWNTESVPAGMYLIRLHSDKGVFTRKVQVK